ncbi:hypothetical protein LJC42_05975 [Eubacteriales bacterium OttesenSCG-928-K08]|nr:hypothetical protein [Eubacteriales bacterium OttesenSCG-928-K08]
MIKKIILLGMLAITLASASACTKVDMSSQSEALEKGGETPPPSLALPMPTVSPEPVFTPTPAPTPVAVPTFTPMPTIEPFDTGVPKEIDELVVWLGEALENGSASTKRLKRKEIANLNDMVFLLNWGDCFASSEEVSKEELLFAVSMYSQDAVDLERSTGEYFPNQSVLYPFEGYEKFDHYSDTLYYTIEQTKSGSAACGGARGAANFIRICACGKAQLACVWLHCRLNTGRSCAHGGRADLCA